MFASSLHSGLSAFQSAQSRASDASQRIAGYAADGSTGDLTGALVDLHVAESEAKAAAKIIDSSHRITGLLLDIEV